MSKGKDPTDLGLSQRLLMKSLETAFEDPALAVRLANLAVRASIHLQEPYDPHSVLKAVQQARQRQTPVLGAALRPRRRRRKA